MNIRFRSLLSVSIAHAYYPDSCRDLAFIVPDATNRLLRGSRHLARSSEGRLDLLFEADSEGQPLSELSGSTLLFALTQANPYFDNITAPVETAPARSAGQVPVYANRTVSTALDQAPYPARVTGGVERIVPASAARPLTLRLRRPDGGLVALALLPATTSEVSFDLRALEPGHYVVDEDDGAGAVAAHTLVVSPELAAAGVWAVLALDIAPGFYAKQAEFALSLQAREQPLSYYVVAKTAAEVANLAINDAGAVIDQRVPIEFASVDVKDDPLAPLLGFPHVRLFRSKDVVGRRQRGPRRIQLLRNDDVLVEHLPQPSAERARPEFIVRLSKP